VRRNFRQGDQIDVIGNTDNVPVGPGLAERFPTNWELGGARAAIVVRTLQAAGIDPTTMRAVSAGQYHPVASNDTPQGRAKNRNTEILLRPMGSSPQ
jgi:chemotaxis protein MotB